MKNFYPLFDLEVYAEFNLSDEQVFDKLMQYIKNNNIKNWASVISNFETGMIILSSPFFKRIYDAELEGNNRYLIVSLYINYVYYVYKIRSYLFYHKELYCNTYF